VSPSRAPIVVIGGPTASGKSAAALALARHLLAQRKKLVILNADALQLYRDLHILSARPSTAEEAQAPHRLYGVMDGAERGSVGRWLELIREELTVAIESGCQPIVVGGTGMYLHALMNGLAQIPEIAPEARAKAVARHAELGGRAFRQELMGLDPISAGKLHDNDPQRLIRAYEVVLATGKALPEWQREVHDAPPVHWQFVSFVAEPTRAALYARCDGRFDAMLAAGARKEVEALLARELDPDLPVMKAVGVPEIAAMIRGDWALPQAREKAQQATRNYAKRQLTWFRHQLPGATRLDTSALGEADMVRAMDGLLRKAS
jgi:tRNA dimethylallyltransferase